MRTTKKKNTEIFINDCIKKIGNKYDYSLVSYKNNKEKANNLIRVKFNDSIKNKLIECLL